MEPVDRTCKMADGTELPLRVWLPGPTAVTCPRNGGAGMTHGERTHGPPGPAAAHAAVVYLHGIQSHSGWYEASSRHLASGGAAVYQVERRGSGRDTAHERGHVDRAETWLEDVAAVADLARRETGRAAVHLMGVSWGGKLALICAARRPDLYRSLVLSAPGIFPRVDVALATKMRVAKSLAAGQDLRRFSIPLDDPNLFTANPERIRYIGQDPLSLRQVTARFLFESRRLDGMVREAARAVKTPTLLALAEHDRIINNEPTRRLVLSMAVRRRILIYPGTHHTLEFEPDPGAYFKDLSAWIEEVERDNPNDEARHPIE